jgi:hypothetical protein
LWLDYYFKILPPKKISSCYGYRTASSMRIIDTWTAANKYSAGLMIFEGIGLIIIGLIIPGFCKLYYKYVLSEIEPKYAANPNMVFISVSTDRYKAEWLKTLQQGEYTSKNSTNLYTNGETLNHPLIKYYNILSYPALMLIDRKGRIFKFASNEMRSKRGLEEALNAVLEIK